MRTENRRLETEESERNEMIISDISSEETKMQTEGIESCGLFVNGGKSCRLCPLECGVNRAEHAGVCGVGGFAAESLGNRNPYETALIARAARHYCEEPPISGAEGSGAIFFSG